MKFFLEALAQRGINIHVGAYTGNILHVHNRNIMTSADVSSVDLLGQDHINY